jgi:hypothetical protein
MTHESHDDRRERQAAADRLLRRADRAEDALLDDLRAEHGHPHNDSAIVRRPPAASAGRVTGATPEPAIEIDPPSVLPSPLDVRRDFDALFAAEDAYIASLAARLRADAQGPDLNR